jgi:hypothetical protein
MVSSGAGIQGNPIHVTLSEREYTPTLTQQRYLIAVAAKGSWVPRFLRFLVVTAVFSTCKLKPVLCK